MAFLKCTAKKPRSPLVEMNLHSVNVHFKNAPGLSNMIACKFVSDAVEFRNDLVFEGGL